MLPSEKQALGVKLAHLEHQLNSHISGIEAQAAEMGIDVNQMIGARGDFVLTGPLVAKANVYLAQVLLNKET